VILLEILVSIIEEILPRPVQDPHMKILLEVITASDKNLTKNKTSSVRILNWGILPSINQDSVPFSVYSCYENLF